MLNILRDFFRISFWLLESDKELKAKKEKKKTSETINIMYLLLSLISHCFLYRRQLVPGAS